MYRKIDKGAPYSLFQGDDGKWGVKDKEGNIVYDAIYIRQTMDDGEYTYFDGISEVCCFSPEDGFSILSWIDPDFLAELSQQDDDGQEDDD